MASRKRPRTGKTKVVEMVAERTLRSKQTISKEKTNTATGPRSVRASTLKKRSEQLSSNENKQRRSTQTSSKRKPPQKNNPVDKLRKRNFKDYAESSLEKSQVDNIVPTGKIPIYKMPLVTQPEKTKDKDLYEFESELDNSQNKKRKKTDDDEDYHVPDTKLKKNVKKRAPQRKRVLKNNKATKIEFATPKMKPKIISNIVLNKSTLLDNNLKQISHSPDKNPLKIQTTKPELLASSTPLREPSTSIIQLKEPSSTSIEEVKNATIVDLEPNSEISIITKTPSKPQRASVLTPWRFNDINVIRNPHFLSLKKSSLPNISQEMVLDHSIVSNLTDHLPESPVKKKSIQKTLNEYYQGCKTPEKERAELSLFDSSDFSPIKHTTLSPVNVTRRILGEKDMNQPVATRRTPRRLKSNNTSDENHDPNSSHEKTCFGFDTSNDENEEINIITKKPKPFRFSINTNDKKYQKPVATAKKPTKPVVSFAVSSDVESEENSEEEEDESTGENKIVGIFEDFDTTQDLIDGTNVKKGRKPRWLRNENDQKSKKRKDVRTKEEEEEAELWAAKFNSMCEDIEQYPLEIE